MEAVRLLIQGPADGTTWVVAVPPVSTVFDLNSLPLAGLAAKIAVGAPLMVQAEGVTGAIYYRWGQASGVVSESALSTSTGIANQVGGSKPVNESPVAGELVPVNSTCLIAKTAAGQPTGILRIWVPG